MGFVVRLAVAFAVFWLDAAAAVPGQRRFPTAVFPGELRR
jgi:hypothetical protein